MSTKPVQDFQVNAAGVTISIFIVISLPLILSYFWMKNNNYGKFVVILAGIGGFVSSVFLEKIILGTILAFTETKDNIFLYILICLFPGIFEETGRYIFYKYVLKNYKHVTTSLGYGIGHGGIESMYVGLNLIFFIFAKDTLIKNEVIKEDITFLIGLMSGIERIIAISAQISLSVIVFKTVKTGKIMYYISAIFLHDFVDFFAFLYQLGKIKSIIITEVILGILSLCLSFIAYHVYMSMKDTTEENANVQDDLNTPALSN